ncbi:MAG TPA: hypothetical protein VLF09_03130 [Cellvibrio sp.]|nr:hypothetical protein [Cellvibrio sp.]
MKLLTRVGGSIGLLYLVCVMFAVAAIDGVEVSPVQSAHADTTSSAPAEPVKVEEIKPDVKADSATQDEGVVGKVANTIPDWAEVLSALFLLAGAITAATPTPKDNVALVVVRKLFDILAFNFGGAKNAGADKNKANRL